MEQATFGGITGFFFEKAGSARWSGGQKVAGLIICVGGQAFEVDETYLRLVSAESRRAHPVFSSLLPVQRLTVPYAEKKSQARMPSPRRGSGGGVLAVDGMPWPMNKNWTVCLGKCGKMHWSSMRPRKSAFSDGDL